MKYFWMHTAGELLGLLQVHSFKCVLLWIRRLSGRSLLSPGVKVLQRRWLKCPCRSPSICTFLQASFKLYSLKSHSNQFKRKKKNPICTIRIFWVVCFGRKCHLHRCFKQIETHKFVSKCFVVIKVMKKWKVVFFPLPLVCLDVCAAFGPACAMLSVWSTALFLIYKLRCWSEGEGQRWSIS